MECKNPPTVAGRRLGGNSVQVVTGVVTGNPGNLVAQSDAIEMPGCRLPHGFWARKDPSKSVQRVQIPLLALASWFG